MKYSSGLAYFRNVVVSTLLVLTLAASPHLQGAGPQYLKSKNGGARIERGTLPADATIVWNGDIDSKGRADGLGVALVYQGNVLSDAYVGIMNEGTFNKNAITWLSLRNGTGFVGQLQNWRPHGTGFMRYADGSRYEGDWSLGKRHGQGNYRRSTGEVVYDGPFAGDKPVKGPAMPRATFPNYPYPAIVSTFSDYTAEWYGMKDASGAPLGDGIILLRGKSGVEALFHTCFENGAPSSLVMAIYPKEREAYFGGLESWRQHGLGTKIYSNGRVFTGNWEYGERSGSGELYEGDNLIEKGQYVQDVYQRPTPPPAPSPRYEPVPQPTPGLEPDRSTSLEGDLRCLQRLLDERWSGDQIAAVGIIAATLYGKSVVNSWFEDENGKMSKFFASGMDYLNMEVRNPIVDGQLEILLPGMSKMGILVVRNGLCVIADGKPEAFGGAMIKGIIVAEAKKLGVREEEAAKWSVLLWNFYERCQK